MADDQGYGDLSLYGGDIPTPHINSIAAAGIRFTDGYAAGPACVPSRCGLLTGRHPGRLGCASYTEVSLPKSEVVLAEYLQNRGYTTGLIGKWHQGRQPGMRPLERGFDEFFGFLGGLHLYLPAEDTKPTTFLEFAKLYSGALYRGNQVVKEPSYLTDALGREAKSFIARHRDEPFFLFLSFNAVHLPLQVTPEYLRRIPENFGDERRRVLAAMTLAMDDAIGGVLTELRESGLEDDTLIFYLSDNGGNPSQNASYNGPLRGGKGDLYEGGVRVPFIMQWRGVLPEGQVYRPPVSALDVAATVLAATGEGTRVTAQLDGVNLIPFLRQAHEAHPDQPHAELYWRDGEQRALRSGDWKLLRTAKNANWALYDLSSDIGETQDSSEDHAEIVADLERRLNRIEDNLRGYHQVLPVRGARNQ